MERLGSGDLESTDRYAVEAAELHIARYRFAAQHARGRTLDIACGVGYGSRILADETSKTTGVLGVDLSHSAIAEAQQRYGGASVQFAAGDAMAFQDPAGFDTIVSLETVEHLPDPGAFLHRLGGLLRAGGLLVASVPTTPSVDINHHHLHDFTPRSFRRLFANLDVVEVDALTQSQRVPVAGVVRRSKGRLQDLRPRLVRYYLTHPAALVRRGISTLRYGFTNRYTTLVWKKRA